MILIRCEQCNCFILYCEYCVLCTHATRAVLGLNAFGLNLVSSLFKWLPWPLYVASGAKLTQKDGNDQNDFYKLYSRNLQNLKIPNTHNVFYSIYTNLWKIKCSVLLLVQGEMVVAAMKLLLDLIIMKNNF